MKILKELWYGRINPSQRMQSDDKSASELTEQIVGKDRHRRINADKSSKNHIPLNIPKKSSSRISSETTGSPSNTISAANLPNAGSESDVTFITAEGNQFIKKYLGEWQEEVHNLFRIARKYVPPILFIDEIDAIAAEWGGGDSDASKSVDRVLTAFLTEMDGFNTDPKKPIFVLAATNYDVEPGGRKSLDPALMRRFDRKVYIDLPDREDRIKYIRMKLSGNDAFQVSDKKLENIAIRSTGRSLAELESVFEPALRSAIRSGDHKVTDEVLNETYETYLSGDGKKWDISTLERVARHEAGHVFLCWHGGETP